jgi:hypothetical protein
MKASSRAGKGQGWHKQSVRHSNARRTGTAGGRYSDSRAKWYATRPEYHNIGHTKTDEAMTVDEYYNQPYVKKNIKRNQQHTKERKKFTFPLKESEQDEWAIKTNEDRMKTEMAIFKWTEKHPDKNQYDFPVKYGLQIHKQQAEWWLHYIDDTNKSKQYQKEAKELIKGKKFKTGMGVPRGTTLEWLFYKINYGYTPEEYENKILAKQY